MRLRPLSVPGPSTIGVYQDPWTLVLFVSVSLAFHLALILALVIVPKLRPTSRFTPPSAISVRMVSLPGPATQPNAAKPSPSADKEKIKKTPPPPPPPPPPKKEVPVPKPEISIPKPQPKPEKAVSISTKKPKKKKYKAKTSLKKKTYKPKASVAKTIDRLEKEVKNSDSRQVKQAIDRIRKQVDQTSPVDRLKQKMAGQGGGAGGGGSSRGGIGSRSIEMMDIYRAEIPYRIQENWAFPSQMVGNAQNLRATLVVKIMPNGEIADIWFEERSGNRYLDESAYRAAQKASPLPPLPPGYREPFYNLGLIFTPQGVQ